MAAPQLERGYTPISNELLEAVLRTPLTSREQKCLLAVARETYGWSRKATNVTAYRVAVLTGIQRTQASRTLKQLKERNILSDCSEGIGIQKDYDAWQLLARFKPNPVQAERNSDQFRSSSHPDSGFNRDPVRGFKLTPHKTRKKENKGAAGSGWNDYVQTFDFQGQEIFGQIRQAIAGTRKTGEISQSVLDGIAQKLSGHPATAVVSGARIFLERNYAADGKREEYLLGIVRREAAGTAHGFGPKRIHAGQTEGRRRIEQVLHELTAEGQGL